MIKNFLLTLVPHTKDDWKSIGYLALAISAFTVLLLTVAAIVLSVVWVAAHFIDGDTLGKIFRVIFVSGMVWVFVADPIYSFLKSRYKRISKESKNN